jgi:hypothetical protein
MRSVHRAAMFVTACAFLPTIAGAQDESRAVAGGGIHVPGWMARVDPQEERAGLTVNSAKFEKVGDSIHVVTGPAITYWNPANKATGSYTVKATFREPQYMNLNDHSHPYGLVIAGNDLGTDNQSYLYCAAYGDGRFIVRGFGPAAFRMNGGRGETNDAIHKASGKGQPVAQEIAIAVKPDKVDCIINGTVVGSYPKADLVGAGKLKSTDGVYGVRFAHNTEGFVVGLTMISQ